MTHETITAVIVADGAEKLTTMSEGLQSLPWLTHLRASTLNRFIHICEKEKPDIVVMDEAFLLRNKSARLIAERARYGFRFLVARCQDTHEMATEIAEAASRLIAERTAQASERGPVSLLKVTSGGKLFVINEDMVIMARKDGKRQTALTLLDGREVIDDAIDKQRLRLHLPPA